MIDWAFFIAFWVAWAIGGVFILGKLLKAGGPPLVPPSPHPADIAMRALDDQAAATAENASRDQAMMAAGHFSLEAGAVNTVRTRLYIPMAQPGASKPMPGFASLPIGPAFAFGPVGRIETLSEPPSELVPNLLSKMTAAEVEAFAASIAEQIETAPADQQPGLRKVYELAKKRNAEIIQMNLERVSAWNQLKSYLQPDIDNPDDKCFLDD